MFKAIGLVCVGFVCYFAYKHGLVDTVVGAVKSVKNKLSGLLPR